MDHRAREANDYDVVADLYDTYVPATFDIPFFVTEAKRHPGRVLELMSGTGRVSLPLVEAGVDLTCVDLAGDMLAVLRQKLDRHGLPANLVRSDICELNLGKRFDLVLIPFHSFMEIVSTVDQRRVLDRVQEHLAPGGTFICTLGNPVLRKKTVDDRLRLRAKYDLGDGRGSLLLWLLERYRASDDHVVEVFEFFEEYDVKGMQRSRRLLELAFRLTSKDEFEALAASAGFKVAALYGDYDYAEFHADTSPFMIWELTRSPARDTLPTPCAAHS